MSVVHGFAGLPYDQQPHTIGTVPQPSIPVGMEPPRRWQKCPVCMHGRGHVPTDFYTQIGFSTSTGPVQCRACSGRGIVR